MLDSVGGFYRISTRPVEVSVEAARRRTATRFVGQGCPGRLLGSPGADDLRADVPRPIPHALFDQSVNSRLNERQLTLLRRIAENSSPVLPSEHHLALSVYALRSRRLVTTSGMRRFWTAELTDLGRSVLEPAALPASTGTSPAASAKKRTEVGPRSVDHLRDARVAETSAVVGRAAPLPVAPPLVPVPDRLVRPHPLIAATRDGARRSSDGWVDTMRVPGVLHLRVAPASLRRALRIAQGLIVEAQKRGHSVEPGAPDRRCAGGLDLVVSGHRFELAFVEETDRKAHVATPAELERAARLAWEQAPGWDRFPSGRLQLRCGHSSDRPLATDRVRWRLEDRLDRALAEIERQAEVLEQRAVEERREQDQREREWEEAMRVARDRLIESQRADLLRGQAEAWRHASEIRAFIHAVRAREGGRWPTDARTDDWLAWAAKHADSIDPLLGPLFVPDAPEPRAADLEPFLNGWSPYGPDRFSGGFRRR